MSETKTKFSTNLLAIAGLVTAIGGLIAILSQTGIISFPSKNKKESIEERVVVKPKEVIEQEVTLPIQPKEQIKIIQTAKVYNLTGYWFDSVHYARYYLNHEANGSISFQEQSFINGNWIISAEGVGTFLNKTINVPYNTMYNTTGLFTGNLVNNGLTINGNAKDIASGISIELTMNKE